MAICWFCYWGVALEVQAVFDKYVALLGGDDSALEFGRGHIVWSDHNMGDDCIRWCLEQELKLEEYEQRDDELVIQSLKELLQIPESIRCCEPVGYATDDDNPERYPPEIETTNKALQLAKRKP